MTCNHVPKIDEKNIYSWPQWNGRVTYLFCTKKIKK